MQGMSKQSGIQGWCSILIFDKYTYLASFWYLSLYKYPKYTYEHPKYTYYQNILMKRVSVQKYPKGGPLGIKCKLFINISFHLRSSPLTSHISNSSHGRCFTFSTDGTSWSDYNVKLSKVFLKFTSRREMQRLRIKLPLLTSKEPKPELTYCKVSDQWS